MKTLVIDIRTPADGDEIIIEYRSPRGGKTAVKHRVIGARKKPIIEEDTGLAISMEHVPAQTARDIATALASQINSTWMKEAFQAKTKNDTGSLVVNCHDMVSDVEFSAEVIGAGGTKVEFMVF